jgi:hypothetical protein
MVDVAQVLQPWFVCGDAQQLVVAAALVPHPEHADRAAQHQHPGEQRLTDGDDERVDRVAVLTEGVLDEPVVARVLGRGEQGAVQPDPAADVVDLVLVAAALGDLALEISTSTSNSAGARLLTSRRSRAAVASARSAAGEQGTFAQL